ncbi:phosphoinositide-3-kinase, regulatory subunit 4 [Cichlidogyrus casuarinus]|uniref:Phosphoinositide-3-kinase, regulatory subunit 4 n=1 Tax=Cichlidogyrus casuarinus TaxID=1844966 RepID=A0ABD2PYG0_9PLAT
MDQQRQQQKLIHVLPTLFSGAQDGRLRSLDFATPANSRILAYAGLEEAIPPAIRFRQVVRRPGFHLGTRLMSHLHKNAILGEISGSTSYLLEEVQQPPSQVGLTPNSFVTTTQPLSPSITASQVSRNLVTNAHRSEAKKLSDGPRGDALYLRRATQGHVNSISDLTWVNAGQPYLVSASMDGVIKFWK